MTKTSTFKDLVYCQALATSSPSCVKLSWQHCFKVYLFPFTR